METKATSHKKAQPKVRLIAILTKRQSVRVNQEMKNPIPMTIPRMALEQKLASTNLIFEKAMVDIERIQPQLKYS